tara:strand:- start:3157 stop:4485 length:1329 start_codon:yes stop_codon:yes gene_type:complete
MTINLKKILRKKLNDNREKNIFYLTATSHLIKYFFYKNFRKNRCLLDPPGSFFYKYRKLAKYFSIPLLIASKYLKKKNIFISVNNNCNFSTGHIYSEIDQLKRMQKLNDQYMHSKIWFITSRKEILGETHHVFESNNFKVLFGGLKRIFFTFVAIRYPSISIDGSLGGDDYILCNRRLSYRIVFHSKEKKRAKLTYQSPEFYPIKEKLIHYQDKKDMLLSQLKVSNKYIVIQIKTMDDNATVELINPEVYLGSIKYFQSKGYDVVLAGREVCPKVFFDNNVIDYSNSNYASTLNDFLLVAHCSLVISSASGFALLVESLDKPLLVINSAHVMGPFGRRTIILPVLLSKGEKIFNAIMQHRFICTYGFDIRKKFKDIRINHMPTKEEVFEGAIELEKMLFDHVPPLTSLQKEIRDNGGCPKFTDGLSRISDFFLKKHRSFFDK